MQLPIRAHNGHKEEDSETFLIQTETPVAPATSVPAQVASAPIAPAIAALDVNKNSIIEADEIRNATEVLMKLDKNGDGKLTTDEYRMSGGRPNQAGALTPEPAPKAAPAISEANAALNSVPKLFNPKALVKPITEIEGILSDGTKATVYKIVVRSIPVDHEMGPWAPKTIHDKGGYWEDAIDKKLYRVDLNYLNILNKWGWNMYDADGTVHRTKNREEFDKVARQELAGWTLEQAKKDGVTGSVIELEPIEQIVTIFLPKNPQASPKPTMLRQATFSPRSGVGVSTNGIRFFPPEPVLRITAYQNIAPLDPQGGHTGFGHEYHYHRSPAVMNNDKSGKIVGWALDGFPVRGPYEPDGNISQNLDIINGHDHDGLGYHYHASNAWPYFVAGFHGPLGTAALGDVDVCDATKQSGGRPGAAAPVRPATSTTPSEATPTPPSTNNTSQSNTNKQPNILVMIADDLGWNGVGFHQAKITTPHLNQLAKEGTELQRFYTYPVCSPSRAAFLTGQMPRRFGIVDALGPQQAGLPKNTTTISSAFQAAGYQTSLIGKWHLGTDQPPMACGFDHFYGFMSSEIDYDKHTNQRGGNDWQRDGKPLEEKGYSSYLFVDEAIKQLKTRDTKRPFFMELAFNAPHVPLSAPEDLLAKHPGDVYGAVVEALDIAIGRILTELDQQGLRENTIVIFFSDNGASRRNSDNSPLSFGKDTIYEGGIRTPCVIRWPGKIAANQKSNDPFSVQDFFPSLVSAAGITMNSSKKIDGSDQWKSLLDSQPNERTPFLIASHDIAMIAGDWKLIEFDGGKRSLFNLTSDVSESKDLIEKDPGLTKKLAAQLDSLKQDLPPSPARRANGPGAGGGRPTGSAKRK
jgi:arylsulfatase A-like enzyme